MNRNNGWRIAVNPGIWMWNQMPAVRQKHLTRFYQCLKNNKSTFWNNSFQYQYLCIQLRLTFNHFPKQFYLLWCTLPWVFLLFFFGQVTLNILWYPYDHYYILHVSYSPVLEPMKSRKYPCLHTFQAAVILQRFKHKAISTCCLSTCVRARVCMSHLHGPAI